MYCKNCGKQVPNDSTYCPYCGTTLKAWKPDIPQSQKVVTTNNGYNPNQNGIPNVNVRPVKSRGQIISEKLDQLGPDMVKKLLKFSKFFKISLIIYFVSVVIFFASTPILNFASKPSTLINSYTIFLIVWCFCLVGLSISNIVVAAINRKPFEINIKHLIVVRTIYTLLLIAIIALLFFRLVGRSETFYKPQIIIPTMILIGFAFVLSGLNAGITSVYVVLTPKRIAEANAWKNSQKTITK